MMKTGLTVMAAGMLLALPALADTRGSGQGRAMLPDFGTLDQSGSGAVSLEEFRDALGAPRRDALIARIMLEADAEGRLDEAALRAGLDGYAADQRTERRDEMQARLFARIDTNSDGEISAEEYEAFTARLSERMERREGRKQRGQTRQR